MGKIFNFASKHKVVSIIIFFISPLLIIPLISLILLIGAYVGKVIPNELMFFKVDINVIVTQSEFIYYYSCFLGIEVTGLLSYLLYKLTKNKYEEESYEIEKKNKDNVVIFLNEFLEEIKNNRNVYADETEGRLSFYNLFENKDIQQFNYDSMGNKLKINKYCKDAPRLISIQKFLRDESLIDKIREVYSILEKIKTRNDVNQFQKNELIGFKSKMDDLIKELDNTIFLLSK